MAARGIREGGSGTAGHRSVLLLLWLHRVRGFSAGEQLSPSLSGRNWRFLSSHPISPSHRGHVLPKVLVRNWEACAQEAAGLAGAVALGCALPPGALTVPRLSLCRDGQRSPSPTSSHSWPRDPRGTQSPQEEARLPVLHRAGDSPACPCLLCTPRDAAGTLQLQLG